VFLRLKGKQEGIPIVKCLFAPHFPLSAARRNPCKVFRGTTQGMSQKSYFPSVYAAYRIKKHPINALFHARGRLLRFSCLVVRPHDLGIDHLISAHLQAHCRDCTTSGPPFLLSSVLPQSSTRNCDHPTAPPPRPLSGGPLLTIHMHFSSSVICLVSFRRDLGLTFSCRTDGCRSATSPDCVCCPP
jgi:hypothetical protein